MEQAAVDAAKRLKMELLQATESVTEALAKKCAAQRQCESASNDENEAIAEAAHLNEYAKKLKADAQTKAALSNASIAEVDMATAAVEKAVLKVGKAQEDAEKAVGRLAEKVAETESLVAEANKSAELASSAAHAADESAVRVTTATSTANTCMTMLQHRTSELHLAKANLLALNEKISSIVGILGGKTSLLDIILFLVRIL